MSNLTIWDHAFALIVFLAYPVYGKVTIRPALDDILERGEVARISLYKEVILTWMVFAIGVFAMWALFDRNCVVASNRPEPVRLAPVHRRLVAQALPIGIGVGDVFRLHEGQQLCHFVISEPVG